MTDPWSGAEPPSQPPLAPSRVPGVDGLPAAPPVAGVTGGGAGPVIDPLSAPVGPPPPLSGTDRRLVAGSIALALALIVGLVLLARRGGDQVAAGAGSTTTTRGTATSRSGPSSTSTTLDPGQVDPSTSAPGTTAARPPGTTRPPVAPEVIQKEVDTIKPWLEEHRGLKFKEPVTVTVLAPKEFGELLLDKFDEEKDKAVRETAIYVAFGMMPPGIDVEATMKQLLTQSVLGFYDPRSKELVVQGVEVNELTRTVIVHELDHALQDQHFDLDRPEYDDRKDEIAFGLSAVAEGDARRIEKLWRDQLPEDRRQQLDVDENESAAAVDLGGVPPLLIEELTAPYELGEPLTTKVFSREGQPALDALFATPPDSSEQVLHDDKLRTREKRIEVPKPPSGGQEVDDRVFGERDTRLLLSPVIGKASAERAATGWGGDWGVSWKQDNGDTICGRIDWAADSGQDLTELTDALKLWAKRYPGATIETPDTGKVRATACVSASGGGGEGKE